MRAGCVVALVVLLALCGAVGAQVVERQEDAPDAEEIAGDVAPEDGRADGAEPDRPGEGADSGRGRPDGSRVLVASAAYPGLGQLLNGTERKAAIIGGVEALLLARLLLEDRWTRNALRHYRETGDIKFFDEYSEHYDRRQSLIWWTAIMALYSIADAYVDAHLSGFEEDVPGGLDAIVASPTAGGGFRIGFEVRF